MKTCILLFLTLLYSLTGLCLTKEKVDNTARTETISAASSKASFNGRFTYTSDAGFTGTEKFIYTVGNTSGLISKPATVTLNVISTNEAPIADAGEDQVIECSGTEGQIVTLNANNSSDPNGDALTFTWLNGTTVIAGPSTDPTVDVSLIPGVYTFTLRINDGELTDTDEVQVAIEDTTPPVITVHSAPTSLWPPNHKYRTVSLTDLNITVEDHCDKEISAKDVVIVSVTSDEPENAGSGGDGNTEDDIVLNNTCRSVDLRSERLGAEDGRVYTLYLEATDASGNTGFATYEVHVPHDKSSGPLAVGGAALYTVNSTTCIPTEASSKIASVASTSKKSAISGRYSLGANYPNPFSTQTKINFVLPVGDDVSLRVYNLYGEIVDVLVNDYREAGEYEVAFDASKLKKGIYIYHLESGTFSATRRMIVAE